jgi:hypothetical protein
MINFHQFDKRLFVKVWLSTQKGKDLKVLSTFARHLLETHLERLEHVPNRIGAGITRIYCQLHLREKQSILFQTKNTATMF